MEEIPVMSWLVCKHLPSYHMVPARTCQHRCISRHKTVVISHGLDKSRGDSMRGRENVAIISLVKLGKKTPVEMKPFSWLVCSTLAPESASRFGVPLANAAERPRTETQELPGHPPVRTLLELHGWKSHEFPLRWLRYAEQTFYFGPLWTSLPFSHYLDVATDGKESLLILVNPPETRKNPWFLTYFCFVGSRGGWDEKKKHSHREEKMPFSKLFRWQMLYYLCRATQSQL